MTASRLKRLLVKELRFSKSGKERMGSSPRGAEEVKIAKMSLGVHLMTFSIKSAK
jgi:hypothetical protein